ncbi:MAG: GIY-YIG nuclease family protein [Gammaproteobacteria bacterium]|nr:GIY-YIG nuclease family protein [Gammaproteobacteria bacterium]
MRTKHPAIYILANRPRGVLYTGVTSNLITRVWNHRNHRGSQFTSRYNLKILVYFELHGDMYAAICREKQIKGGSRAAKIRLVESLNPEWRDLYPEVCK